MTSTENRQDDLWDIQISIAKAIAKQKNPSLAQLHHEILEEVGHIPCLDLIDYFVGIAGISDDEVEKYFQYIGTSIKEKIKKSKKDSRLELADNIANGAAPTVLKFRQAFKKKYDELPSEELIEYFLKRIQSVSQDNAAATTDKDMLNFVEKIASGPNPTVLKLRNEFNKQFGFTPCAEVTQFFLKKIQEKSCVKAEEAEDEEYESKVNFAKTVANGLNLTVFQFRQAYEKVYNEAPPDCIIDVFIKNLPRRGDESSSV